MAAAADAEAPVAEGRMPLDRIYRLDGFNPRTYFDPDALNSLAESIKRDDVFQPIVVRYRPTDDGDYHLLAGERRWRAARMAGLTDIPYIQRDVDDEQARRIAIAENDERANLAPSEEARKAREMVDACGGDREMAARELNWSRKRLEHRMLLLNATERVLSALDQRQISLGMAELLAGQPHVTQDGTIGRVIEQDMPIARVKEAINAVAIPLAHAAFDLEECRRCPFNTEVQQSLFGEAVEGAHCLNRECFSKKTSDALEAKRNQLAEEQPVVRLATETSPDHSTILQAEGPNGVGHSQLRACRQCPYNGAVLEDRLGAHTGEVRDDVCFNLPCWREKVAAHQQKNQPTRTSSEASASAQARTGAGERSSASRPSRKNTGEGKGQAPAIPRALHEHVNARAVDTARQVVRHSPQATLAYAILGLQHYLHSRGQSDYSYDARIRELLGEGEPKGTTYSTTDADRLRQLLQLDYDTLVTLQAEHAEAAAATTTVNPQGPDQEQGARRALVVLRFAGYRLSDYAPIDSTLLSKLPKKSIQAILTESGFWDYIDRLDDAKKRRSTINKAKKGELPERIMEQGFDFRGCVPSILGDLDPQAHDEASLKKREQK